MSFDNAPAEMQALSQWVTYGMGKIPYTPGSTARASSKDPASWGSFEQARADVAAGRRAGIGFEFAQGGGIVGVDFDHCLKDGQADPWTAVWLKQFNSYTEVSPSGTGLHIFCLGELPGKGVKRPQAEMYDRGRYFTVTGDNFGPVLPLRDAQEAIDALYAELATRVVADTPTMERKPVALSDDEIIQKAMTAHNGDTFSALWEGDISGYPSQSEAEVAFCNIMAFWTNGDPERIDAIYRRSGLSREKWDRPTGGSTYGMITIMNAVNTMTSGYDLEEYRKQEMLREFATPPVHAGPLETFTAADLQSAELGETRYIVIDLLPQGLSLLASPPKYGKSWLVLDLCLAVASGAHFLGHETNKCGCWYLALEDGLNRLQHRMNKLLGNRKAPENLMFTTAAPDLSNGLLDELEKHMEQHHSTGLIVIDTLQKVRGQSARNESAYNYDYREIGALKAFADRHGILLLLVHHLRKMGDDADPHNRISGTNGIMGAADTSLVLTKAKRSDETAVLSVVGRDVESSDTVMKFDKETCKWQPIGSAEWYAEQEARQLYQDNPLTKTIKTLLGQNGGRWRGTMSDLMNAGREIAGVNLADNTRALSTMIKALEGPLFEYDDIIHTRASNGTGGGPHCFSSYTVDTNTGENTEKALSSTV